MNLAKKKRQFHFSFLKIDFQNPKFSLEYLTLIIVASLDVWQY